MRRSKLPMRRLEDHFEILNEIGSGAYGTVYRARGKADRCLYAVKEMIPPQQRKAAADRDGAGPQVRPQRASRGSGRRLCNDRFPCVWLCVVCGGGTSLTRALHAGARRRRRASGRCSSEAAAAHDATGLARGEAAAGAAPPQHC